MKPVKIEATNFVSFEHFEYTFQDGVTALVGLNKTDDNQGSNGSGKALTMDSDILTPNGFVKMRNIKVGDIILHPSGAYQVVRAIPFHDTDIAYKITFSDGTEVKCNKEHLWKVRTNQSEEWSVISLGKIMERSKDEEVFFEVPGCFGRPSKKWFLLPVWVRKSNNVLPFRERTECLSRTTTRLLTILPCNRQFILP